MRIKFFYKTKIAQRKTEGAPKLWTWSLCSQGFSFQTPDSRVLKQGWCAFKNRSEHNLAAASDSRSPEFGPQDVCLPMRPHKAVSHRHVLSQIAASAVGSWHRWKARDTELAKGFLKSPCKLKNLGTNRKCSVLSVSAYIPCGQHTNISAWIKSPSVL